MYGKLSCSEEIQPMNTKSHVWETRTFVICAHHMILWWLYQVSKLSGSSVVWIFFFCSGVTVGIDI